MEDYFRKNPRHLGILCLLLGTGLAIYFNYAYHSGSSFTDVWLMLTPFLLLYGLVMTLQPRFYIPKGEFSSAPPLHKLVSIVVFVVGLGLASYLRFFVFKDWK